jgi:FkbM family methyltransferase
MQQTLEIRHHGKSFHVIPGRNGPFWEKVSDGRWEPQTYVILQRFVDKNLSYIDIGSWIGPTLLYGSQLAKSAYGIEPDPIAYAELAANVATNEPATGNVRLFNGCITRQSGRVAFGSRGAGGDSTSSLLFSRGETRWEVEGLSFADFIERNQISDCGFIKMDIEGGEYGVVPTMVGYLEEHRPTLYLSLHPRFLGRQGRPGLAGKVERLPAALANTARIIACLRFYKYAYDEKGNRLTAARWLWAIRHGLHSVVVTDERWR